uniref:Uncharacterized protein n=1 Tax=Macaca nemestrina TaxID=9545 RepID=A0A2K6D0N6_MACNE
MSNIGYEWFNQVMIKLLQSIIWACYLYIKDFFQVGYTLFTSC